jgi:hypothetical protein
MWFEELVGFAESDRDQVRTNLELQGDRLTSRVNGQSYGCGRLETPSLAELRSRVALAERGPLLLREVVANVQELHCDPAHGGALFQAASQFNLLEMPGPDVTPEEGVGVYEHDHTQGPACAIACGAGTIYRNYFVPVGEGTGQSADRQVNCLADLGRALGNLDAPLWTMRNGYALLEEHGLQTLGSRLAALGPDEIDTLRGLLRIGVHWDVEVTLGGAGHHVTQVYGSALPVAYGRGKAEQWAAFARLVLEASYEATMLTACLNADATGSRRVFLTLLGGGVFGNEDTWILTAIERALERVGAANLDVAIVSFGQSRPAVRGLIDRWARR